MNYRVEDLVASSALAWITLNKFVNENRKPIEFSNHRFLIDYIADNCPVKVTKKAAQVGLTVAETLISFHEAGYWHHNVIHTLQTKDVIKGFVFPKVNPIIAENPAIKQMVTVDSENLKQVGDSFIYYRGAQAESQAINISADVLNIDEYDRSNPQVVSMYPSRLDASDYKRLRYFSNPSNVGFGVDALYTDSNQLHWFITCNHCNHEWFIDFKKGDKNHYVNISKAQYSCGKCDKAISDQARRNGRWVAKFPNRDMHGYWFSQLMAPWITAKDIISKQQSQPIDVFHNMTLGLAWTPSDLIVNRETILRACAPSNIARTQVAIGVDQNVNEQIWVAGTSQGIFAHGKTTSWEDFERIKLMYNAVVVADPAPYPTMPKLLAEKYNDFYLCYFKKMDALSVLEWKGRLVYADRTRTMDIVANEITEAKLLFREHPYALEDYIADWQNLYRTTIEKEDGRMVSTWLKKENKESDFSFATLYFRVALSRLLSGGSLLVNPTAQPTTKITQTNVSGGLQTSLEDSIAETFAQMD